MTFKLISIPIGRKEHMPLIRPHENIVKLYAMDECLVYKKNCIKQPLKNRQNKDLNDK